MIDAQDIIDFWFADAMKSPGAAKKRNKFWYGHDARTDQHIRHTYANVHERAISGALSEWQMSPVGELALVIILDQFSRNMYRGSKQAFSSDNLALAIAKTSVASGNDQNFHPLQRIFLYHPYHHAENLSDQDEVVRLYKDVELQAPGEWKEIIQGFLKYAIEHRAVIERFGRFPHRNQILNRDSTVMEVSYLESGASNYGQG